MSQKGHEAAVLAAAPKQLRIGWQWVDAEGAATFDVLDPATGEVLCHAADASPADGMRALEVAVAAQANFAALPRRHAPTCLPAPSPCCMSASTTWLC